MVAFKRRSGGELGKENLPYRIVIIIKVVESHNGDDEDTTSRYLSSAQMAAIYNLSAFSLLRNSFIHCIRGWHEEDASSQ